jgi:bacillithiol system protein YtxJ
LPPWKDAPIIGGFWPEKTKTYPQAIAVSTDIRHETPQVILFVGGKAVWKCAHRSIT